MGQGKRCVNCAQFQQSEGSHIWGKCTAPSGTPDFRSRMNYCDKTEEYKGIWPVCEDCVYFQENEIGSHLPGLCFKPTNDDKSDNERRPYKTTGKLSFCESFTRKEWETGEDGSPIERRCGNCQDFTHSHVNDNGNGYGYCRREDDGSPVLVSENGGHHCLGWRQRGVFDSLFDVLLERGTL